MDNPAKTPIARQQNVAQCLSSKKQLSTKTADRHAHAKVHFKKLFVHGDNCTMHESFLKCTWPAGHA